MCVTSKSKRVLTSQKPVTFSSGRERERAAERASERERGERILCARHHILSLSLSLSLSFTYSYFNPVSLTHAHTTTRALALSLIESEFTPFIFYREQIHLSFIRTRSFGASSIKSDLIFVWKLQLKSKQDKRQLLFNFFSLHLQRGTNLLGSWSQCAASS